MNESHDYADLCELIRKRVAILEQVGDRELADGGLALLDALEDLEGAPEEFERAIQTTTLALAFKKNAEEDDSLRPAQRVSGQVFSCRGVLALLDALTVGLVKVHVGTVIVLSPELIAFVAELLIPFKRRPTD